MKKNHNKPSRGKLQTSFNDDRNGSISVGWILPKSALFWEALKSNLGLNDYGILGWIGRPGIITITDSLTQGSIKQLKGLNRVGRDCSFNFLLGKFNRQFGLCVLACTVNLFVFKKIISRKEKHFVHAHALYLDVTYFTRNILLIFTSKERKFHFHFIYFFPGILLLYRGNYDRSTSTGGGD